MTVRVQPVMSPGHLARVTEVMALSDSAFRKSEGDELGDEDIEKDEEDESLDANDERERLDDEGHSSGCGYSRERSLGLGYGAARRRALESIEEIAPSTYEVGQSSRSMPEQQGAYRTPLSPEWSSGSLPISPSSPVVPSPVASSVANPTTTILVEEDQFLELYTRSGVVRDEIFSQRYMFRSLEHEQERTTVTLIHDMLVQQAAMQRKLQEMRGYVTALEQERDHRE
ncbi:hypothetical protein Tco_1494573 [Tanacetum coccineum]